MNVEDIHTLYAYNRWANERLFAALEKASEHQFTARVQSSFPIDSGNRLPHPVRRMALAEAMAGHIAPLDASRPGRLAGNMEHLVARR